MLFFQSCQTYRVYTIDVIEPAPVFLDSTYKKIGVINRAGTAQENKSLDVIDKVLSAEGQDIDENASNASTVAMNEELLKNHRFDYISKIDSTNLTTPGMGIFPASIAWDELNRIGAENDVEIIFVLSFFDTDSKIDYSTRMVDMNNPLGIKISVPEHCARIDTRIKTGWRIYDIRTQKIRDEIVMNETATSTGRGINPAKALESIANRDEKVIEISKVLGKEYAQRVLPQEIAVSRAVYVRGSDNLMAAARYLDIGNWEGAASLWELDVNHHKKKVAGRASYNLALASELNYDFEKALEWANISYLNHKNDWALDYINRLKDRIAKKKELEEQQKN